MRKLYGGFFAVFAGMAGLFISTLLFVHAAFGAEMSSTNYKIESDSVNVGGTEDASSASYRLTDTAGEAGTGLLQSALYNLFAGFRQMVYGITACSDGIDNDGDALEDYPSDSGCGSLSDNDETNVVSPPPPPPSPSGGGSPPPPPPPATTTPDTTPPANPSNFSAIPNDPVVSLSWINPTDPDFSLVRIMRSTVSYPSTPTSGLLVYEGAGTSVNDANVSPDVLYYYSAFAKDIAGNFSSGAVADALISSGITPPPTPPTPPSGTPPPGTPPAGTPPPPGGPGGESGGGGATPPGSPSSFPPIKFSDFQFTQITPEGDRRVNVSGDDLVDIDTGVSFRVFLPREKVPGNTKLILFTLRDPSGKTTSIILAPTGDGSGYAGVFQAGPDGKYSATAEINGPGSQPLQEPISGTVRISPPSFFSSLFPSFPKIPQEMIDKASETIGKTAEAITPLAGPIGVLVGAGQAVAVAANVGSLYDLYLLLLKFIGILLAPFRRRKPVPWGTVYDSVTKQPIDPAVVVVKNMTSGDSKDAITDLDGRYGFLLASGSYLLQANKTHYQFPSKNLAGKTRDEVYDNLYFGDKFLVEGKEVVKRNIPLDPVEFDWNEFAKNKEKMFYLYSRKENFRRRFANGVFYIGLALSAYATYSSPTRFNVFVLSAYLLIVLFQSIWKHTHAVTRLLDAHTGLPMPFALISVVLPSVGVLIKKVVTDEMGRFYILVEPGTYDIMIEEKQLDGSYRERTRLKNVELAKGVIKQNIRVL